MVSMWTPQQIIQRVLRLAEEKSVTRVLRRVRCTWNVDPPGHKAILKWDRTLRETGSLLPQTGKHAKMSVNEETIERVRTALARSPRKSIRRASTELQIPISTIQKITHMRLHLCAFKIQLRHHIKPNDRPLRAHFAAEMVLRIENDNSYLYNIVFSDETTFHLCGKLNKHHCRIWGSENPHVIHEHERHTTKMYVWCGLTRNSVTGSFFFIEALSQYMYIRTYCRTLLLANFPQFRFSRKMGHRTIIIDRCLIY